MLRRLIALGILTAAVLMPYAAARGGSVPTLLTQVSRANNFQVQPHEIIYTGDGTGILGHLTRLGDRRGSGGYLHWKSWGQHTASAVGTVWLDDCMPSCATGTYHAYHARVYTGHVQGSHFRRLTIKFIYQGRHVLDQRRLGYTNGDYFWDIAKQSGFG